VKACSAMWVATGLCLSVYQSAALCYAHTHRLAWTTCSDVGAFQALTVLVEMIVSIVLDALSGDVEEK
jgi:hypothetical protein